MRSPLGTIARFMHYVHVCIENVVKCIRIIEAAFVSRPVCIYSSGLDNLYASHFHIRWARLQFLGTCAVHVVHMYVVRNEICCCFDNVIQLILCFVYMQI